MQKYIIAMIAGLFVFATAFADETPAAATAENTAAPAAEAPAAEAPAAEAPTAHAKHEKHAKKIKRAKKAHAKKALKTEVEPTHEGAAPTEGATH